MKCCKSLMFDGLDGVAGVTLLFFTFFLKIKNKDRGNTLFDPRNPRKCGYPTKNDIRGALLYNKKL